MHLSRFNPLRLFAHAKRFYAFCAGRTGDIFSFLMVSVALGAETLMHLLSIPHMEGWWLPIASGSSALTGIGAWVRRKYRKNKSKDDVSTCEVS